MRNRDAMRGSELKNGDGVYLPVCLCLDTSRSMLRKTGGTDMVTGEHIGPSRLALLNQSVQRFVEELFDSDTASCAVEIAVVTFDDTARVLMDFSRVEHCEYDRQSRLTDRRQLQIPELQVGGEGTSIRAGIELSLELMEKCKADYRRYNAEYYQPWLVLITDGRSTDPEEEFEQIKQTVHDLIKKERLWVYPFAVGTKAGAQALKGISPEQPVLGLDFDSLPKVFNKMSQGAVKVSSSSLGTKPPIIEPYTVVSWAYGL